MTTTHLPLTDLSAPRAPARTHLLPSDMSGVLNHNRHGRPTHNPLIHPGTPNTPHDEQLIDQARKWVAQTFFGTLLKQMRNSPFKSPLFEGGKGGEAFDELYDQHLVEHMSRGVGNKLAMAIARKIVNKTDDAAKASAAYARQSTSRPAAAAAHGHQSGADPDRRNSARPFPKKQPSPAPVKGNSFQTVRAHVAPGF